MIKIDEVIENKDKILQANVLPDVIKNRFDLLHPMIENLGGGTIYIV